MSLSPQYAAAVQNAAVQVSAANSNRDGTGTITDVITGGISGTRIDEICIVAVGNTSNGMIRLYISDGTVTRLWREVPVTANIASATNPTWSAKLSDIGLTIKNLWKIRASTEVAEVFNIIVTQAGDF